MGLAVSTFHGVERRMTSLGAWGNMLFLEDFAHHPTAISAAIQAVREAFPDKRLLTVIEPRSWSLRRNRFADPLRESLLKSDEVWISEIYQKEKLTETERLDVPKLAAGMAQAGCPARAAAGPEEIWAWIEALDSEEDRVVLVLSNGAFGGLPGKITELCRKEKSTTDSAVP